MRNDKSVGERIDSHNRELPPRSFDAPREDGTSRRDFLKSSAAGLVG